MNLTKTQTGISVAAVAAFLFGGGGSLLVWAGDQRYAKNSDIADLYEVVEENSVAQQATVASVDVLLIQVLDIRIDELETEIRDLEDIAEEEDGLSSGERSLLADNRRYLADALTERNLTLNRILARRSQ
jgi:predicted transcriptional regulator